MNHSSLHKECKTFILGTQLAADFHISETQENRHYVTSSFTAVSKSFNIKPLNIKPCTLYEPFLLVVLKSKVPVWIMLGRAYKLFRIPHHVCVSFPSLSHLYTGCNLESGILLLWKSTSRFLSCFMSTDMGRYLEISHSFIHTHTQSFVFIWVIVKVGFYIILVY